MDFADRELKCAGCGVTFVFSAGEQEFFRDKGFKNDPKRCKQCKASGTSGVMVESHVKCFECGIDTTVPFKPTGKRPVLCATCFSHRPKAPDIAAANAL
jgi:CxxC-x17-CxxC domain-containing protein